MKESYHQESLSYFRKARVTGSTGIIKGEKPKVDPPPIPLTPWEIIVGSIVFGILGLLAATAFYTFFPHCPAVFSSHGPNPSAFDKAGDIGLITMYTSILFPLGIFVLCLFIKRLSPVDWFKMFISYFVIYAMVGAIPVVEWLRTLKQYHFDWIASIGAWAVASFIIFILTWIIAHIFEKLRSRGKDFGRFLGNMKLLPVSQFGLWLGISTGELSYKSHGAGMAPGQHITLSLEDACQNIAVMGGIGSGKTTRAIQPLLLQLLDQDCGGLIFDIKGDFKKAVFAFAETTEKSIETIGPGQKGINLLQGLSPEVAASFLKSAFLLSGESRENPFWINTATELCRNALGVLSFMPSLYSLWALYRYLFDREFRIDIGVKIEALKEELDIQAQRLLDSYLSYRKNIFSGFDDKVVSGVNATVAQVLSPFSQPDLVDAFCSESEDLACMEDVLKGTIFLVDLPLSRWGLGGKVVYTFIKLRFFNVMQRRLSEPSWNQDRPVFFICDEFQEIVSCNRDGLSDLNFWDKSRSSKTIGIISGQSVSSFYAAIGNRDMTHALLQNFRQRICFKTEDEATLEHLNHLLGRVDIKHISYQQSVSSGYSGSHHSRNVTSGTTTTLREKAVLDPQVIRELENNQAIAILSLNNQSRDDVINVRPVFV